MRKIKLTQERLKELLDYNPQTGLFKWKISSEGVKRGSVAGYVDVKGYRTVGVDCVSYRSARLAWFWMRGYWPEYQIDHIDRDRSNDMWNNLRHVSSQCNIRNRSVLKNNTSGVTGVTWFKKDQRWVARLMVNGTRLLLGNYRDKINAVKARWDAEKTHNFPSCNTTSSSFLYLKKKGII